MLGLGLSFLILMMLRRLIFLYLGLSSLLSRSFLRNMEFLGLEAMEIISKTTYSLPKPL